MPLSHIVMHFALCNAALRPGSQAELPVQLVVTDKINRKVVDQKGAVSRYEGETSSLEFDIPWGLYRAAVTMRVGKASCSGVQYFSVLADHNRSLKISLHQHPVQPLVPTIIMGTAPFEFSYVEPTVVVFGNGTQCNGAVGTPLDAKIEQVNDSDGYYASLYPSPGLAQHSPLVVAVRLKDSQGGYHYIRVPGQYVGTSVGWPSTGQFNVNQDVIDDVASKPEDTLLCPRMYETVVH